MWWNDGLKLISFFPPLIHCLSFLPSLFLYIERGKATEPEETQSLPVCVWEPGTVALPGSWQVVDLYAVCCYSGGFNYGPPRSAECAPTERTGPNMHTHPSATLMGTIPTQHTQCCLIIRICFVCHWKRKKKGVVTTQFYKHRARKTFLDFIPLVAYNEKKCMVNKSASLIC